MRSTRTLPLIASAAALAIVSGMPAQAADLLIDPPVIEVPEVPVSSGGWYLRGDIGYAFTQTDGEPMFFRSDAGFGYESFTSSEVEDHLRMGIGLGYKVNDYLRVDGTVSYSFDSDFSGSTSGSCAGGGFSYDATFVAGTFDPAAANCTSSDVDSLTKLGIMANAYIDLGTFSGFTPYVGGGLGGSYVSYDGLSNTIDCPAGLPTGVSCVPTTFSHGGEKSWRFAWALHAGFSYEVSKQLALDFGYTYSRIEGGAQFAFDAGSQSARLMPGAQGFDKGFEEHILRAGIRYHLW